MKSSKKQRARSVGYADDAALVIAVRTGDLSGLGILFDRYADDVARLLARLAVPAMDVDDAVQETFIDVLHAARGFDVDAAVRPWLLGIAAMVARRRRRSLGRLIARLQAWAREPEQRRVPTPIEEVELAEAGARALRALTALSARKRETFVLVVLEGLSCAEAAVALRVPVATVWTRLHAARLDLRRALEEAK